MVAPVEGPGSLLLPLGISSLRPSGVSQHTYLSRVEDSSIFSFFESDLVGDAEDASRARLAVLSERGEGDAGRLAVAEDESVIGGAKAQRR